MKQENEYIRLIVKSLRGELTPEEELFLLEWKSRSEVNEQMYQRLVREYREQEEYSLFKKFDARREWLVVAKGIRERRSLRRVRRVAVAASFILLGISSFFIFSLDRRESGLMARVEAMDECSFGRKARLILPGGDTLLIVPTVADTLVKQLPFVENDGNTLIYHATALVDSLVYNTLEIPRGGAYSLQLADGTRVMLNSDSRLRFPQVFSKENREVYLEGEGYFQVAKDVKHPFIVHCQNYDVRVSGTTFNVSAYPNDGISTTTLVEGRVNVENGRTTVVLTPGMMASVSSSTISTREVDVDSYISWTKDQFSFSEERLEDLLRKISRWYDVDFVYDDLEVKEYKFSGFIPRYESIVSLFEILEQSSGVRFTRKGSKIFVSKN